MVAFCGFRVVFEVFWAVLCYFWWFFEKKRCVWPFSLMFFLSGRAQSFGVATDVFLFFGLLLANLQS